MLSFTLAFCRCGSRLVCRSHNCHLRSSAYCEGVLSPVFTSAQVWRMQCDAMGQPTPSHRQKSRSRGALADSLRHLASDYFMRLADLRFSLYTFSHSSNAFQTGDVLPVAALAVRHPCAKKTAAEFVELPAILAAIDYRRNLSVVIVDAHITNSHASHYSPPVLL